jgi:hypothetical protein
VSEQCYRGFGANGLMLVFNELFNGHQFCKEVFNSERRVPSSQGERPQTD